MSLNPSIAGKLGPSLRQQLAIEVLVKMKLISHQAVENGVSHKFLQQQV